MRTSYNYTCKNCNHYEEISERVAYQTAGKMSCTKCGTKVKVMQQFHVASNHTMKVRLN